MRAGRCSPHESNGERNGVWTADPGLALGLGVIAWLALLGGCEPLFGGDGEPDAAPPGPCVHATDISVPTEGLSVPSLDGIGTVVSAQRPPPPISGGTMAIAPDDLSVVIADPDRDRIYQVSLENNIREWSTALQPGDEPGRVTFNDTGDRAFVALRRGRSVAVVDTDSGAVIDRYPVCASPRGVAFDPITRHLYTACHGGDLVIVEASTGELVRRQRLENGLRDVVVDVDYIYVSVFRTAELLVLDHGGELVQRMRPWVSEFTTYDPDEDQERLFRYIPGTAWRTVPAPDGGVFMLHQRGREASLVTEARGGYHFGPGGVGSVVMAITSLHPDRGATTTWAGGDEVLPVDLALIGEDGSAVIAVAGSTPGLEFDPRVTAVLKVEGPNSSLFTETFSVATLGQSPVAVVAWGTRESHEFVVQHRDPALLERFQLTGTTSYVMTASVSLSDERREDTGHRLFHANVGGEVACASCHPEGGTDAMVWSFTCIGLRRTQGLQHGLRGTEPFHWDGDMDDMGELMDTVFSHRMGGPPAGPEHVAAMESWLDSLRPPPRELPRDPEAVARGQAIFEDESVGCASCHAGARFTSNESVDVGTHGTFQVPSLIGLVDRAPYMHDGCAATLYERFTDESCGGGDRHGVTSHLTSQELDDLVAFLDSL